MKQETEYRYRKQIDDLKKENARLSEERSIYRGIAIDIIDAAINNLRNETAISETWIVSQLKRAIR